MGPRVSVAGWLTAGLVLLAAGCNWLGGMVGTEIEVTGGQRSIEEQVLGSFEQLGEEVYLVAGVRSVDASTGRPSAAPPTTAGEQRALEARRRMEFNRDDVQRFLREGYLGEGNDGLPAIFGEALDGAPRDEPRLVQLIKDIYQEEAADRRVIMQRIVDTTPGLKGEAGMETVGRVLAARFRQEAPPGTPIQTPDGQWTTR